MRSRRAACGSTSAASTGRSCRSSTASGATSVCRPAAHWRRSCIRCWCTVAGSSSLRTRTPRRTTRWWGPWSWACHRRSKGVRSSSATAANRRATAARRPSCRSSRSTPTAATRRTASPRVTGWCSPTTCCCVASRWQRPSWIRRSSPISPTASPTTSGRSANRTGSCTCSTTSTPSAAFAGRG